MVCNLAVYSSGVGGGGNYGSVHSSQILSHQRYRAFLSLTKATIFPKLWTLRAMAVVVNAEGSGFVFMTSLVEVTVGPLSKVMNQFRCLNRLLNVVSSCCVFQLLMRFFSRKNECGWRTNRLLIRFISTCSCARCVSHRDRK